MLFRSVNSLWYRKALKKYRKVLNCYIEQFLHSDIESQMQVSYSPPQAYLSICTLHNKYLFGEDAHGDYQNKKKASMRYFKTKYWNCQTQL